MSENGKFPMRALWARRKDLSGRRKAQKRENECKGIKKKNFIFALNFKEFSEVFLCSFWKDENESFNFEARKIIIKDWENEK